MAIGITSNRIESVSMEVYLDFRRTKENGTNGKKKKKIPERNNKRFSHKEGSYLELNPINSYKVVDMLAYITYSSKQAFVSYYLI